MSTGWLNDFNKALNKRLCRFLINRYLGALLKIKVTLEQLTVDLYNGQGHISDVVIDSEVRRASCHFRGMSFTGRQ